jgi:ankyrin repeat protein
MNSDESLDFEALPSHIKKVFYALFAEYLGDTFVCPISFGTIENPIILDGHLFDLESIEMWLKKKSVHPITSQEISRDRFAKARVLDKIAQDFKKNEAIVKRSKKIINDQDPLGGLSMMKYLNSIGNESLAYKIVQSQAKNFNQNDTVNFFIVNNLYDSLHEFIEGMIQRSQTSDLMENTSKALIQANFDFMNHLISSIDYERNEMILYFIDKISLNLDDCLTLFKISCEAQNEYGAKLFLKLIKQNLKEQEEKMMKTDDVMINATTDTMNIDPIVNEIVSNQSTNEPTLSTSNQSANEPTLSASNQSANEQVLGVMLNEKNAMDNQKVYQFIFNSISSNCMNSLIDIFITENLFDSSMNHKILEYLIKNKLTNVFTKLIEIANFDASYYLLGLINDDKKTMIEDFLSVYKNTRNILIDPAIGYKLFRYYIDTKLYKKAFDVINLGICPSNYYDENFSETPMLYVCKINLIEMAIFLLDKYQDQYNEIDNQKNTALIYACKNRASDLALRLMSRMSQEVISMQNLDSFDAIYYSRGTSMKKVFSELLPLCELNHIYYPDVTLFKLLTDQGNKDHSQALVDTGKDIAIDYLDSRGHSSLSYCIYHGYSYLALSIINLFDKQNKPKDVWGAISLDSQYTPLMYACYNNYGEIIKMLVKSGKSNFNFVNGNSQTALEMTISYNNPSMETSLILMLESPECNINYTSPQGNTLLITACKYKNINAALKILESISGDLLDKKDQHGCNAYYYAKKYNMNEVIKKLEALNEQKMNN